MAFFNWIVAEAHCPNCNVLKTMRFQTRFAAVFDAVGNQKLYNQEYKVGDTMKWWPLTDVESTAQLNHEDVAVLDENTVLEGCIAECPNCHKELYGLFRIQHLKITDLMEVGLLENWPEGVPA